MFESFLMTIGIVLVAGCLLAVLFMLNEEEK